jgi:hypothetical protein
MGQRKHLCLPKYAGAKVNLEATRLRISDLEREVKDLKRKREVKACN